MQRHRYRLLVQGSLDDVSDGFADLHPEQVDGLIALDAIMDQAGLFGVIARIQHHNLELIEIKRFEPARL